MRNQRWLIICSIYSRNGGMQRNPLERQQS